MNKVRLFKIYELRGKIHPIEQYIIDLLDGIEEVTYDDDIDYMKYNKTYFRHDLNRDIILVHHSLIYRNFGTKFGCSKDETKEIMKYLLEKHLNLTINLLY